MAFFRLRWAASRVGDPAFRRILRERVANSGDYWRVALSLPRRRQAAEPVVLRLQDGGIVKFRSFMSAYIFAEIFVDEIYDIDPGPVRSIIDVGANVGLFTLWASRKWPAARILAYEPEPANFAALEETIADNGLSGARAIPMAIAAEAGSLKLYLHPSNIGGHSIVHRHSRRFVQVDADTLANAVATVGGRCDLLKLDCEGAEGAILKSITPPLASRIGAILYEGDTRAFSPPEVREHLRSLGFRTSLRKGIATARRTTQRSAKKESRPKPRLS